MEDKKCCETGGCEKCDKNTCCGCKLCKKCPMLKILIPIVLLSLAFYAGTFVERNDYSDKCPHFKNMIDDGYEGRGDFNKKLDDSAKIPPTEETQTPVTPKQ